ncbi:unnamed protein product, partial [Ectocarpus sp. 6 AP-2014]
RRQSIGNRPGGLDGAEYSRRIDLRHGPVSSAPRAPRNTVICSGGSTAIPLRCWFVCKHQSSTYHTAQQAVWTVSQTCVGPRFQTEQRTPQPQSLRGEPWGTGERNREDGPQEHAQRRTTRTLL